MPLHFQNAIPDLRGDNTSKSNNAGRKKRKDIADSSLKTSNDGAIKPPSFLHREVSRNENLPKQQMQMQLTQLQSNFIDNTMKNIRQNEMKKKQKTLHNDTSRASHRGCKTSGDYCKGGGNWTSIFLNRLNSNPDVAQIVASSGGLVTYWNEAFSGTIDRSKNSLRDFPITIFELIESESLPSLYGMLAMALHRVPVVEDSSGGAGEVETDEEGKRNSYDGSISSHLSITLPCKLFHGSSSRYNITIIYMDDLSSRCFLGILTSTTQSQISTSYTQANISSSDLSVEDSEEVENHSNQNGQSNGSEPILPHGRMQRINDNVLCQLIFGTE